MILRTAWHTVASLLLVAVLAANNAMASSPETSGSLRVCVTDQDDLPLQNAQVTITDWQKNTLGAALTDSRGCCDVGPLPAGGNCRISINAGCEYTSVKSKPLSIEAGKTTDFQYRLDALSVLSCWESDGQKMQEQKPPKDLTPGLLCGAVRGKDCEEVRGATVVLCDSNGKELAQATTNYFGHYYFYPPPLGAVAVRVGANGYRTERTMKVTVEKGKRKVLNVVLAKN